MAAGKELPGEPTKQGEPRLDPHHSDLTTQVRASLHKRVAGLPPRVQRIVLAMVGLVVLLIVPALSVLKAVLPEHVKDRLFAHVLPASLQEGAGADAKQGAGGMVEVPAETFTAGSTPAEVQDVHRRCVASWGEQACVRETFDREVAFYARRDVAAFRIDATEVTNETFLAWLDHMLPPYKVVQRGGSRRSPKWIVVDDNVPSRPIARLHTEDDPLASASGLVRDGDRVALRSGAEALPVVHVSWFAAHAFCNARRKRLPTEVQWELAARGTGRREFPWGSAEPGCDDVVYGRGRRPWFDVDGPCRGPWPTSPEPVKTRATDRTPEGIYDLGGNVAEWVEDRFASEREERVVRGGSWTDPLPWLRAASRSRRAPEEMYGNTGFRCAEEVTGRP